MSTILNETKVQNSIVSHSEKRYNEEEYSNYIDSAEVVIDYYKNTSTTGLDKYFLKIEDWLDKPPKTAEDNKPYVIQADEGVGKKTLLVKWMEYHKQNIRKKNPDIIIPHFATTGGNNSNYFFAIYRILIKLREQLNIGQKVELLEEKLRKYFAYWLEVCNKNLQQQIIRDAKIVYDKVILIIEGIDHFIDPETNREAAVAFWLPRVFPDRVRVIVTADKNTDSMEFFNRLNCQVLHIPVEPTIVQDMIKEHADKQLFVSSENRETFMNKLNQIITKKEQNFLYIRSWLSCFLPSPKKTIIDLEDLQEGKFDAILADLKLEDLEKIDGLNDLFVFIINFYMNRLMDGQKFAWLLMVLSITQKGLYFDEIKAITQITIEEWKLFLAVFNNFIMNYRNMWIINNELFKKAILQEFAENKVTLKEEEMHIKIANVLDKNPNNSIRKLEEQTFHLYMNKNSQSQLKDVIANIENFLLLFNPNNKYDLCRYWQRLEDRGFDPVIEYNKAIENFEMHYHPSADDVFRIIVQLSRFLKEFSDFETYNTPEFRHPPINGILEELEDIGLLNEIVGLKLYYNMDEEDQKAYDTITEAYEAKSPKEKFQIRMDKYRMKQKKNNRSVNQTQLEKGNLSVTRQKEPQEMSPTSKKKLEWVTKLKQKQQLKKGQVLKDFETLNVDIPTNRVNFRKYFMDNLLKIQTQQNSNHYQSEDKEIAMDECAEDNVSQDRNDTGAYALEGQRNSEDQNCCLTIDQLHEQWYLQERIPQNYYYKRWLWVQFPWACTSQIKDYSAKLKKCFSSATQYMSVGEERAFTKQALKIAIEAKLKKQSMYKPKNPNESMDYLLRKQRTDVSIQGGETVPIPKLNKYQQYTEKKMLTQSVQSSIHENYQAESGDQKRMKGYAKSSLQGVSQLSDVSKIQNNQTYDQVHRNGPFFITEEYLNFNTLNKELEIGKSMMSEIPAGKNDSQFSNLDKLMEKRKCGELDKTNFVLEKSREFKEKSRKINLKNSVDHNTSNLSNVLPRLKNSIDLHSNRELYLLEQQAMNMQKEYDNLYYQNKTLAKELKQFKLMEHSLNAYANNTSKIEQGKSKYNEVQTQLESSEHSWLFAIMSIDRLKIILKICEDNKKQNEEYIRALNFLLNNYQKMITWEQDDIRKVENEIVQIRKLNNNYVDTFLEKMQNHYQLIDQIKLQIKEKKTFDQIFSRTDNIINDSAKSQVEKLKADQKGINTKRQQKDKASQLERTNQQNEEKIDILKNYFQRLASVDLDLTSDNYNKTQRFQTFLADVDKKAELTQIIFQRENEEAVLNEALSHKQSYLETVRKAYSDIKKCEETHEKKHEKEAEKQQEEEEKEKEAQKEEEDDDQGYGLKYKLQGDYDNLKRSKTMLTDTRLAACMSLNTIFKKLDIPQGEDMGKTFQFDENQLITNVGEKLKVIKEKSSEEDYTKFMEGKYDYNLLYKKILYEFEIPHIKKTEMEQGLFTEQ